MRTEIATHSLIGDRENNQDRVSAVTQGDAALVAVLDGMGGHAEGERAAQVALDSILESFAATPQPIVDPPGFLRLAVASAHEAVVRLGRALPLELRPRATCAIALIDAGRVCWAHVGDSRVYLLRDTALVERTRDHSHVEVLRREGLISEEDMQTHPMRNYVEYCLGGDPETPVMNVTRPRPLEAGDIVLACSDGFWSGLEEQRIIEVGAEGSLESELLTLAETAVSACAPGSDNTTVAALRWIGT